jgi:hypothetical protein
MRHFASATALVLVALTFARAEEPTPKEKPFEAPPPQAVPKLLLPYLPPSLPRPGTREVWQYYGVDNRGRWVARVILSPSGAYYYYNGAPFRFTTTQPQLYMPYVVD